MSRRRKRRSGKGPNRNVSSTVPQSVAQPKPELVLTGPAFEQFDAWIDQQLETLVGRWVHLAAPAAAAGLRRISSHESRRSETA